MSLTLKISSLFVRTLAKPIANTIKRNAREHERFRKLCVSFAQSLHRIDMRMRLGLLQDPAVIEKQIARELAEAEAKRKKALIPTVKTEAQTAADDAASAKAKEEIREKVKKPPRIRPLSEAKAIESGANFISETFLFIVAGSIIVFESWRSSRKESNRREDVTVRIQSLESKVESLEAELHDERSRNTEIVAAKPSENKETPKGSAPERNEEKPQQKKEDAPQDKKKIS